MSHPRPPARPNATVADPPANTARTRPRLTVTEMVYHSQPGFPPKLIDLPYAVFLENDEQAYERRVRVTEEWQQLESGWLTAASLVVLHNAPVEFPYRPTDEEEGRERAGRTVEVAFGDRPPDGAAGSAVARFLVPPSQSFRAVPARLDGVWVRTRGGATVLTVNFVPT